MIEIHERFEVAAAPERVWEVLSDPYTVVGCVPGASIVGRHEDGSLDASLAVKFGPPRVTFLTRVALEMDAAARQGRLGAQGKDNVGGTRIRATATYGVAQAPATSGSIVSVNSQVEVSGRLASLIEGGASVVVKRLSAEFAERLAARCAPRDPDPSP
jgi:carbon monoxide dehydrogenase subunit G